MGRAVSFVASVLVFTSTAVLAQVNSWINPASGAWDQATNWSLGVLPGSSQLVTITNSGFKAVGINPSTPVNFPGSMTVSALTIQGATNSRNTLLLNFFGTAVPLTVLNGLTLQDGAQILDFNSGLVVQGGMILVTNSQINQDGGFIRTTNAQMFLQDSVYNLTNGDFEGGQVMIGTPVSAQFNQYGGTVLITDLVFGVTTGSVPPGAGGTYALFGGNLSLPNGLTLLGEDNTIVAYLQSGGTNRTTDVSMEPGVFGVSPTLTLSGGLLADNQVTLEADGFAEITLTQNGGTHIVTNLLSVVGAAFGIGETHPGLYQLNGGTLSAGSMNMDATMGTAEFNETNGIAQVGELDAHPSGGQSFFVSAVNLSGGTLACSNVSITDGGDILQTGGAWVVSNSLAFSGFIKPGPTFFSTYTLLAGTLTASNIIVGGIWIIGDSTANRITNPGTCTLSNTIVISNAVEQLGRFILPTNATINLAGSASQLSFANSSGEIWAGGETLVITNWNGNLSGGGAEQLKFGTDQSGLTTAQLGQIEFQIGTNLFPAKILATGEVVPNEGSTNAGLVNSWISPVSGNWQDATSWSLGIPPASNQSVMITNSGFKAVAIQSSTPINFPGSMSVSNLMIASPTNGANTLLMNFVGAGNPLVIGVNSNKPGSLIIGDTNSAMVMFSSGLIVNNALGTNNTHLGEFEVAGTFIQSDNSEVVADFLDLNFSGTYNLTNGEVFINNQFILGTFNQFGGTNFGAVIFTDGGKYNLNGGVLQGNVGLDAPFGGLFNQSGGTNISTLDLSGPGEYQLSGGLLVPGDLQVGPSALLPSSIGAGAVVQMGGTDNAGNITMGVGSYTLEGGVLTASNLALPTVSDRLGSFGTSFDQSGGSFSNNSTTMNGVVDPRNGLEPSTYTLSGGVLRTPSITMTMGLVNQSGGTNSAGVVTLNTSSGYNFTNGLLIATNIQVAAQSTFVHAGGSFGGLDNIQLVGGSWVERTAGEQLGQLQLGSGTNSSSLNLPSGACVLRFADSSAIVWATGGRLTIQNWSGSTNGGGSQRVFFGTSASGMTAQQLSQVQFSNPAGLAIGTYSARILSDGEVVPNQLISASIVFSQQGNNLVLTWPTGWTLQSATNVVGPYNDVTGATSPYTINTKLEPQQYFRLRQ